MSSPSMRGRPVSDAQRAAAQRSKQRMLARARERGRLGRYRIHTAILMPFVWLLGALPVGVASSLGGWIGRRLIPRFGDMDTIARTMRVPFPDLDDAAVKALAAEMGENIGRVLGESLHLEAFSGADNPRLILSGIEHVEAARAGGRGVLFLGGHFANWELFEVALANLGLSGAKVLQHPHNPYVLETMAFHRYAHGLDEQIASGESVFARVRDTLAAGRVVQMLADQRPHKGIVAPFFGIETLCNVVPARAARETGAPIVLMSMKRVGPVAFTVSFAPPRSFGPSDDEREIVGWINQFYEAELRATPGAWLWGHPRWDDALKGAPAETLETPPPPVNGR